MGRYRRVLPFALVAACLPLLLAWATTISSNCTLGDPSGYCRILGINRTLVFTAMALPASLVGGAVGWLCPDGWVDAVAGRPLLREVFEPPTGTVLALGVVASVATAFAPPLFFGTVTASVETWLLLAVPYYPALALLGVLVWLGGTVGASSLPYAAQLSLIVASFVVAAVAQAAWFYLLADALGRLGSRVLGSVDYDPR